MIVGKGGGRLASEKKGQLGGTGERTWWAKATVHALLGSMIRQAESASSGYESRGGI